MWWEMGEVPAEELGRSLTLGREGLSGLPHHKKTGPKWIWKGLVDLSTMSNGSTALFLREGNRLSHISSTSRFSLSLPHLLKPNRTDH